MEPQDVSEEALFQYGISRRLKFSLRTPTLIAGPIIEQAIVRITHRDSVADMIRKGKDLERMVLSRAVRWHIDDRVMVHGNKTIVFED